MSATIWFLARSRRDLAKWKIVGEIFAEISSMIYDLAKSRRDLAKCQIFAEISAMILHLTRSRRDFAEWKIVRSRPRFSTCRVLVQCYIGGGDLDTVMFERASSRIRDHCERLVSISPRFSIKFWPDLYQRDCLDLHF